jgi:hypothetical protein
LNGNPLLTDFDIISDANGSNVADERVFTDVSPARDGIMHLHFSPNPGQPLLCAIQILPGLPGQMLPVRIAASETPVHDDSGHVWRQDAYFIGGDSAKWVRNVRGAKDQALFYSSRWGHFDYAIPVAEGSYSLTLYFTEAHYGAPSQTGDFFAGGPKSRLFDIFCNGEALARSFDIYKEAGGANVQLTRTFHHLKPNAQGKLNISFVPVQTYAVISAIEVLPEVSKKVRRMGSLEF